MTVFAEIKVVCACCLHPSDMEHSNPAYTISAALCYATQLVNILSHILDVNLPKKLCNRQVAGAGRGGGRSVFLNGSAVRTGKACLKY